MECNQNIRHTVTTYCSRKCYKREMRRLIWCYYAKKVLKEFINLSKSFGKLIKLIYKFYIKDFLITSFKISIIFIAYFSLSTIIYLVETYIK